MGRARVDVAWREWLLAVNHRLGHPCVHRRAALLDRLINLTRRRLLHSSTYIPLLSASRTRQAQALVVWADHDALEEVDLALLRLVVLEVQILRVCAKTNE